MALVNSLTAADVLSQADEKGSAGLSRCWGYRSDRSSAFQISSDQNQIFLSYEDAKVEAISTNGKTLWTTELGGTIASNIAVSPSSVFIATAPENKGANATLRSLSRGTGIPGWTFKLSSSDEHRVLAFDGAVIVVSGSGLVISLDPADGRLLWTRDLPSEVAVSAFSYGSRLFVGDKKNRVYSIDYKSGATEAEFELPAAMTAVASGPRSYIVFGDQRGNVISLDQNTRVIWRFKTGGRIIDLFQVGELVYAASNDNFIYCLTASTGAVKWKTRLAGRPSNTVRIADSFVLAATPEDGVVVIELNSGRGVSRIPLSDNATAVHGIALTGSKVTILTDSAALNYAFGPCENK